MQSVVDKRGNGRTGGIWRIRACRAYASDNSFLECCIHMHTYSYIKKKEQTKSDRKRETCASATKRTNFSSFSFFPRRRRRRLVQSLCCYTEEIIIAKSRCKKGKVGVRESKSPPPPADIVVIFAPPLIAFPVSKVEMSNSRRRLECQRRRRKKETASITLTLVWQKVDCVHARARHAVDCFLLFPSNFGAETLKRESPFECKCYTKHRSRSKLDRATTTTEKKRKKKTCSRTKGDLRLQFTQLLLLWQNFLLKSRSWNGKSIITRRLFFGGVLGRIFPPAHSILVPLFCYHFVFPSLLVKLVYLSDITQQLCLLLLLLFSFLFLYKQSITWKGVVFGIGDDSGGSGPKVRATLRALRTMRGRRSGDAGVD